MAYSPQKRIKARRLRQLRDRAKLSPWDEMEIRESCEAPRVIAERYGIHYTTVYWIRFREQWAEMKRLAEKRDLD